VHLRIAILDGLAPELQALVHRDGLQIGFGQQALVGLLPGVDMDGGNGGGVARDRGADLVQGHDVQQGKKGKQPGAQGDTNAPHCRRCGIITALHGQAGTLGHTRNTPDSIAVHDLWTLGKAQFRPYFGQTTV
jgi:hypothetical protein